MKRMIKKRWLLALLPVLLTFGCEQIKDPLTFSQFRVARNASMFSNTGSRVSQQTFYRFETIFLSFQNLYPNEQTDIQVVRLRDKEVIKRALLVTDENGEFKDLPIWYNVGFLLPGDIDYLGNDHEFAVHLIQPGINRPWLIFFIPFEIYNVYPPYSQIRLVDAGGNFLAEGALTGNDVYIEGSALARNTEIKLWVVQDHGAYLPGDTYIDVSGDWVESAVTSGDGALALTRIWSNSELGSYDVIVDTAPFGRYNTGDMVGDPLLTGLVVQNPPVNGDIVQDIACDPFGVYRDVFDSLETVYARVDAINRPAAGSEFIAIFVTPHKATWMKNDSLAAVSTVGTHEMPVHVMWNPYVGSLPVTRTRGKADPNDPTPIKMWPGEYDMIIDVDRNGFYDPGIDVLDGGPRPGFIVPGKPPSVRLAASADLDFLGIRTDNPNLGYGYFKDASETRVWGILVKRDGGFLSNIELDFKIVQGPGQLDRDKAITNGSGRAYSLFSGATYGSSTVVRVQTTVNDTLYAKDVLIFRKIPFSHNQGTLIGN